MHKIIYNIGAPESVSIEEIVKSIIKLMDKDIEPEYIKKNDIFKDEQLSVKKIKDRFGFVAKTTLEKGLKKILDYMNNIGEE